MNEIDIKTASDYAAECMNVNLVPMISGSPGLGKSAMGHQLAKKYGLELIDERLSTYEPVDLNN